MSKDVIPQEALESKILLIRGHRVMLDRDLAALYGVETRMLNQAVKRNSKRFPEDFVFRLTAAETSVWVSQFVIPNSKIKKGLRISPLAFTENGVAMLSSVLNSPRAIAVNIQIMRMFTRLRGLLASHRDLARRMDELEKKYDAQFKSVFDAIRALMEPPDGPEPKRITGFKP
ncbi:MAG: ORF6N domain-containing protein [Elusimicrobia bacterium]|nr:ORF6N domain-containing protein [Elusimicrobiota bacterium]